MLIIIIINATASPQANGQVERVNRVIRPILSKLSQNSDYSDWVSQIHSVEYALNNIIHSSTHFAPATLLFGIEQRGPILDEITELLEDKNNQPRKDLQTIRAEASTNIKKSQRNNEKQHVKHNRPAIEFEEGDFVVIKNKDSTPDSNTKLIAKFKGPYVIHKRLPNDRYVIRDIDGCQLTQLPYDGVLESNNPLRKATEEIMAF